MDPKLLLESLVSNLNKFPFMVSATLIVLTITMAMLNIVFARNYTKDMSILKFGKRMLGAIFTFAILLVLSLDESVYKIVAISNVAIYLTCLREISVAVRFLGIDLTGVTVFIDLALKFLGKKGSNILSNKGMEESNQKDE